MNGALGLVFFGLFAAGLLVCAMLVPLARRLALRVGLVDHPGARKIHARPIPYGGGIAIFVSFLVVLVGAYLLAVFGQRLACMQGVRAQFAPYLGGLVLGETLRRVAALLGGGALVFALGLVDDRRGMGSGPKLAVQCLAALLLWACGIRITLYLESTVLGLLITVLWVVGITNAMNLLDNMDGLSAGVGAIAACMLCAVALQTGQMFLAAVLVVLVGVLAGFLFYNFAPASVFMGDAGALFLGYILAALAVAGEYRTEGGPALAVVMPLVVFAIPIFDTATVMLIRYRRGRPLMQGDRNHFSHRLVRLGMTTREAVLTIYVLSATVGLSAVLLVRLEVTGGALVLLHTAGILVVVGLLEHAARRSRS